MASVRQGGVLWLPHDMAQKKEPRIGILPVLARHTAPIRADPTVLCRDPRCGKVPHKVALHGVDRVPDTDANTVGYLKLETKFVEEDHQDPVAITLLGASLATVTLIAAFHTLTARRRLAQLASVAPAEPTKSRSSTDA